MFRYRPERSQSAAYTKSAPLKPKGDPLHTVRQVNDILKRLREATLPREPYLVSVPSNVPYNHSQRYVPSWHYGTPFDKDEEQLQYLSFIPPVIEETLLSVEGGWSDEQGNLLLDEDDQGISPTSKPATSRNSPADDTRRKKISLGQYKNKVKGEMEMTTDTPPRRGTEKQTDKVNGVKEASRSDANGTAVKSRSPSDSNGKKRPREDDVTTQSKLRGEELPVTTDVDRRVSLSPRPSKKPKLETILSPSKSEQPPPDNVPRAALTGADAVPGLLSPTLPPKVEEEPALPPLLSPTIPPSIQEFLDLEPSKLDKAIDRHRTDSVRNLLSAAGLSEPGSRKSPGLSATSGVNRIRSDSAHSVRSTHSATTGLNRIVALAQSPGRASTPTRNGASPGPRQRHTISLKYGKRNRKRVEALLKFAPRPKKTKVEPTAAPVHDHEPARRKLETVREASPGQEKPRDDLPGGAARPQKARPAAFSVSEKPRTPIPAALNSPSVPDAQLHSRSTFTTPKKDLKSTAMQRVVSIEGLNEARTPQADHLSTPQPSAHKHSPSAPTSAPSTSTTVRDEWAALGKKYFDLGRKIKTEGTLYGADASSAEQSLSVVLIVEGLLCFMINAFAMSVTSSRAHADPGWRAIMPYLEFVLRHVRKTPHLHGLAVQLGALCRQHVHKYDLERLAKEALPDDQSASAPTPGSDGNTKTSEDSERAKQKYLDFRDQLISNSRRCQAAWLEGSRLLSPEALREEFPKTWKRRAVDFSLRGTERSAPRELGGSFYLPVDGNASALEGVRYAVEVLQEWCEREKMEWNCRIEL